jgi:tetratricopeptide (TPR) repeat protein
MAALGVLLSLAPEVLASPSFWDRTRDPALVRTEALLIQADRARIPADSDFDSVALIRKLNERSALMIQFAGGAQINDARLQYLWGDCLVHGSGEHYALAHAVLQRALSAHPEHPEAARALFNLAIASNFLGDHKQEHAAYTAALEREWDREGRARIFLNRGESNMSLGDLAAAQRDYGAATHDALSPVTRALAQWGLAVALDRSNDFPGAQINVRAASGAHFGPSGQHVVLDLEGVFFTPDYEEHYYRALALLVEALDARETKRYVSALQASELYWQMYLQAAPADGAWAQRPRQHLEFIRKEIARLLPEE